MMNRSKPIDFCSSGEHYSGHAFTFNYNEWELKIWNLKKDKTPWKYK